MDLRTARIAAGMTQSQLAIAARVPQPNLSAYENDRRTPSPEVAERLARALRGRPSERLAQHRDAVLALLAKYRASKPRVFGSVARGEDEAGSDLDLIVDFGSDASLIDEVGLRIALTELLGIEVDVVGADTLRGDFGRRVARDAVPV
ncbi:MAG: helix-turn-helix domain-containing protein [Gulosibacter sp.]|uniref:helix-turn-helix domain-containing protein n=1 Tax=Gulosibacter sp. TaxID=2817531 RepID=UPI003F8F2DC9